ncbi:MAG: putative transporter permease protein [Chloroflexi bacterium]|nr:putative transporter permease protein [Chloroflexota bacterium]
MKINPLRAIYSTAYKDLQVIFKDRGFLVVLLALPAIFSVLFGTISQRSYDNSRKNITFPVALVNQDNGSYGAQIGSILNSIDVLEISNLTSSAEAEQQVRASKVVAAVLIPAELTQNVNAYQPSKIEVLVDRTQQKFGGIVTGIMKEVVSPVVLVGELSYGIHTILSELPAYQKADEATKQGFEAQTLAVNMAQMQKITAEPWISLEARTSEGKDLAVMPDNIFTMIVPSFTVYFAFFIVGTMSAELLKEKQEGSLRRLIAAPIPRWTIILGKMLAFVVFIIIQVTLLFGAANVLFDMLLGDSVLGLVLVTLAMGLSATGLGMLVAAISKTYKQADTTGTLLGFIMGALGGCFAFGGIPFYKAGGTIQTITRFIPQGQAMVAYDNLMVQGYGLASVLPHVGALLLFALIFLLIAVWRFRFE